MGQYRAGRMPRTLLESRELIVRGRDVYMKDVFVSNLFWGCLMFLLLWQLQLALYMAEMHLMDRTGGLPIVLG